MTYVALLELLNKMISLSLLLNEIPKILGQSTAKLVCILIGQLV